MSENNKESYTTNTYVYDPKEATRAIRNLLNKLSKEALLNKSLEELDLLDLMYYCNNNIGTALELINLAYEIRIPIGQIARLFYELLGNKNDKLKQLRKLSKNNEFLHKDISSIKKRIKYCKNSIEKKRLEQELNEMYKKKKRGNKCGENTD
jgi:AraC-like DNA-binding protein